MSDDGRKPAFIGGADRALAAPATVTLGGTRYRVAGRTCDDYAEVCRLILDFRPDAIPEVARQIRRAKADAGKDWDAETERFLLAQAVEKATAARFPTNDEVAAWWNSVDGTAYLLWRAIRNCPENERKPTLEEVRQAVFDDMERGIAEMGLEEEAARQSIEHFHEALVEGAREVLGAYHEAMDKAGGGDASGNSTGSPPSPRAEGAGTKDPSPGGGS